MSPSLSAIVLAAGASERLGQPKQLVEWQGRPLVAHAAGLAAQVAEAGIVVVTGAAADHVGASVDGVQTIHNPKWATGMASSLCAGLRALPDCDGVLVLLCDQPLVTTEDIVRLADVWHNHPASPVAAEYAGTRGVPAIFPLGLRDELLRLEGEQGAGGWLRSRADVIGVPMENAAADLDTPADLSKLREQE